MAKKVKGLKKVKKFGIGKFLVMALVLGGGLVYGTQMVQKSQESRSNAAAPKQVCKCSKGIDYNSSYLCGKAGGKWSCTLTQPTITPTKKTKAKKYYFYNGSKCVQTGDSYSTPSLCKGNVRSACYGSLNDCNSAHPTPTPSLLVCSSSNCNACTSLSNCNNAGCYWETLTRVCTNNFGICGTSPNTCIKGKVNSTENSKYHYVWKCDNYKCYSEKSDIPKADYDNCNADTVGEVICNGKNTIKCVNDYNRFMWIKVEDCLNGCNDKVIYNSRAASCKECRESGSTRCFLDNKIMICNDIGLWSVPIKCNFGCDSSTGGCKECNPGDRKCGSKRDTATTEICQEDGYWKIAQECPNGCADTYCI